MKTPLQLKLNRNLGELKSCYGDGRPPLTLPAKGAPLCSLLRIPKLHDTSVDPVYGRGANTGVTSGITSLALLLASR